VKKTAHQLKLKNQEDYMQGGVERGVGEDASVIELLLGW
jgi:hypothetical protein